MLDERRVSEVGAARSDDDVARRQRRTAEDQSRARQLVADAVRADRQLGIAADDAAAAEPQRQDVRHAEVRTDTADVDCHRCFTRKPVLEDADVRGRATDVDDRAIPLAGKEGGAAHRVRRARGERRHRVALGVVDAHERAVVLGEEDRRLELEFAQRGVEGVDDAQREVAQTRVDDRGVLALEQPRATDLVRETDGDSRELLLEQPSRFDLELRVHRREDGRNRDRS